MLLRLALVLCMTIFLIGCASPGKTDLTVEKDLAYPEFETFPTPRTFDGPGTVFRVDQTNTQIPVKQLSLNVKNVGEEQFATFKRTVGWNVGALAKYLGATDVLSNLQASGKAGSTAVLDVRLGKGQRFQAFDDDVRKAIKDAQIEYDRNSNYYVIIETIAVQNMYFDRNTNHSLSADAQAAVNSIVEASANADWHDNAKKTIDQDFGKPFYVFFKRVEILPPGNRLNPTTEPKLLKVVPGSQPLWTQEQE